jgi:hypothetical protein
VSQRDPLSRGFLVVDANETAGRVLDPPRTTGTPVSELFPDHGFEQLHGITVTDDDADSLLTVVAVRLPGAECARTSETRPHSE